MTVWTPYKGHKEHMVDGAQQWYGAQTVIAGSIYHLFRVPLYGAQTGIAVLHLPYVPCVPA